MRYFCILFTALTVGLIAASAPAQAQETQSSEAEPLTRIEADSEAHEIRFYVDGSVVAVIKEDGLHVRDDVQFGGTMFDSEKNFYFTEKDNEKEPRSAQ